MAGQRLPGPILTSSHIEDGTSTRSKSPLPGPTGLWAGQSSKQGRAPPPGVRPIDPSVVEQLIRDSTLPWRELNPHPSALNNCPAAASAVDELLGTGDTNPAPGGDHLTTYSWPDVTWSNPMSLTRLMTFIQLNRFPRNHFITVMGTRTQRTMDSRNLTRTHFFILAKVGSGLFYLDAWRNGQASGPSPTDVRITVEGLLCSTFQYSHDPLRVRASHGSSRDLNGPFPPGLENP